MTQSNWNDQSMKKWACHANRLRESQVFICPTLYRTYLLGAYQRTLQCKSSCGKALGPIEKLPFCRMSSLHLPTPLFIWPVLWLWWLDSWGVNFLSKKDVALLKMPSAISQPLWEKPSWTKKAVFLNIFQKGGGGGVKPMFKNFVAHFVKDLSE